PRPRVLHHDRQCAAAKGEKLFPPASYLPPEWATRLNCILINLVNHADRPKTWEDHAAEVLRLRQSIVGGLELLRGTLEAHFRRTTALPLVGTAGVLDAARWEKHCRSVSRIPQMPQVAVDEWGFTSEQSEGGGAGTAVAVLGASASQQGHMPLALLRHKPYLDLLHKYARAAWNFMQQVGMPLALQPFLARGNAKEKHLAQGLLQKRGEAKLNTHLPTTNLAEAVGSISAPRQEFRGRFDPYFSADTLDAFEARERGTLSDVWAMWLMFTYFAKPGGMSQPVQWAARKLDEVGRVVCDSLRSRLAALSVDILSQDLEWERGSALWLRLEVAEPVHLYQARASLLDALHATFKWTGSPDITAHVARTRWRHIVIVPTFQGKALTRTAWPISMDTIALTAASELGWWSLAPQPVPESSWRRLAVELWTQPLLGWADEFRDAMGELRLRLDLALGLRNSTAAMEIDSLGRELLEGFLLEQNALVAAAVQRARAVIDKMDGWMGSLTRSTFNDNPNLGLIHHGLRDILARIDHRGRDHRVGTHR
uniref:hypothetical protein n=1 Tax=Stigmatella hybrida TaxID=394097 RepID=UPI001CDA5960